MGRTSCEPFTDRVRVHNRQWLGVASLAVEAAATAMIINFSQFASSDKVFDFCIAGAGPAGITLALKLAGSGHDVLILEAGGYDYTEASQSLYDCETSARELWPKFSRLRYFGGSSNHWSGRCRPFEAYDFESSKLANLPGWPIDYAEISPYLPEAMKILDLPESGFTPINQDFLDARFEAERFANSPPTRFGTKYRDDLSSHNKITVLLNANLTTMEAGSSKTRINTFTVVDYTGVSRQFSAEVFILALGGIENARFLLNQQQVFNNNPNTNYSMLGKCFMEHLNVKLGEFILTDPQQTANLQFVSSKQFVTDHGVGGAVLSFSTIEQMRSYGRTAKIKTFLKTLACDLGLEEKVDFIASIDCPGTGVITSLIEQSPDLNSYIGLNDTVDAIGLRQAVVHWEINDHDKRTIRLTAIEMAQAMADSGVGLVKLESYILDDSAYIPIARHSHHMGSTRMAEHARFGVVDRDCKVFGFDNLYVAGSSIFASAGFCNPTMPLIQFTLRLAEHLSNDAV